MHIELTIKADSAIAKLDGELDEGCVRVVRDRIDKFIKSNYFGRFVFDFDKLTFMDSTGIGMLLGRYKQLRSRNVPIFISNAKGHVDFILSTAGIYTIMKKIS